MYLVLFCFKKPVKSENKIEILSVHWCESIHNKLQNLTTFSSDTNSRLRSLLLPIDVQMQQRNTNQNTLNLGLTLALNLAQWRRQDVLSGETKLDELISLLIELIKIQLARHIESHLTC